MKINLDETDLSSLTMDELLVQRDAFNLELITIRHHIKTIKVGEYNPKYRAQLETDLTLMQHRMQRIDREVRRRRDLIREMEEARFEQQFIKAAKAVLEPEVFYRIVKLAESPN